MPISAHLSDLPEEVYRILFEYTSAVDILRLEQCNRRLQALCDIYWKNVRHLSLVHFMRVRGRFDVASCYRFDLVGSALLRRVGERLLSLDLSDFGSLDFGLRAGLESAVIDYCADVPKLVISKRLVDKEWMLRMAEATGSALRDLTLTSIYLRGFGTLDDSTLSALLRHWTNLRSLDLRNNPRLALHTAAQHLPVTLEHLDCRGNRAITEPGYRNLFTQCPNLQSLSMTYQPMNALPFHLLPNLTRLQIDIASTTTLLSVPFVDSLCQAQCLVQLSINGHLLNDQLILLLCTDESLSGIQHLCIDGPVKCTNMTSEHVVRLLALMPQLTHLTCTRSPELAWNILEQLHSLAHLHTLDISYSLLLTDCEPELLDTVRSHSLRRLVWNGLFRLNHPQLTISDAQRVTRQNMLDTLRRFCPSLKGIET